MKTNLLQFFILAVLLMLPARKLRSQASLSKSLAAISEHVKDVQIDKVTYKQSINILDGNKGKIGFVSVATDDKGKTSSDKFEFFLSDIDKNTVLRKTSGKKLFVSLSVDNNQKFIKHYTEDKPDNYTSSLEILSAGADEAQQLVDLFKSAIPLAGSVKKNWNTASEALAWLKSNISKVISGQDTYEQAFSFGEGKEYLASLAGKKTDQKGVSTDEKYEFSILDLDPKKSAIKVSGTQLSVYLEIKGNEPYIKYTRNGEEQNYEKNLEIYAEDSEQAHNIIDALAAAAEKSRAVMPDFGSLQKSLDFIAKHTADITLEKKTLNQKISFVPGDGTKTVFTSIEPDSKGKPVEERYEFYLSDIDTAGPAFKVSGRKIILIPSTRSKAKFIKYYKDNELQDFQNEIQILMEGIDETHEMNGAFKSAIKQSAVQLPVWKNTDEAIKYINGSVKGETLGSDVYKLTFSALSADPLNVSYKQEKTDSKGSATEQSFEFYPYMLDPGTVKVNSSGKYLNIEAFAGGKEPFIKVYKDGRQQAYDNDISIMAFDSRQAQTIAEALKYIAANSKPKAKVWADRQSAMKFIADNVVELKNDEQDMKQKVEAADSDPCKITYTVSSSDSKGKTTEEIYEFNLPDMNGQAVDLKVRGKDVNIVLACKTKEKLVKVYKNGSQQAWGGSVEISAADIETARNVADAFRSLIKQCEK